MKKNKILVFCDDLTGCGDIAYWALALNLDFLKQKSINFDYLKNIDLDLKNFLKDYDIFIINTESRSDNEKILKNKMNIIIDFLQNNEFYKNFEFIFKKIDSTLRGNFALEINEMIEKFDMNFVPFIAAYPEYDRFTRNGYHYINNVLLQDTIFAKDPKNPIKESKISTIIYNQLGLSKNLKKFEIYDVQNFYELEKNVKSILEKENRNIKFYAGSSRFFGEILKQKQKFYTKIAKKCNFFIQNKNNSRNKKYENFLVIAGSFNEQTKSQLQYFYDFKKNNPIISENKKCLSLKIFENKNIFLLQTPDCYEKNYDIKKFINEVYIFLKNKKIDLKETISILTGGETAYRFVSNFGINELKVIDKFDIGIVICRYKNMDFILKSGGFGKEDFLEKVYLKYF